ncbi:sugar kinase [Gilvimarinus chinensis]|uniref:sugar kinase n=1 Tax=Gilvimarinus chinensis TaxID=396005 RepID=UPI0003762756|nr:sugar kinase [Gilvimarinus chinensis]
MTVACFGEVMLRLSPNLPGETLRHTHHLKMEFAGAESNVATGLSALGNSVRFLSKFPRNTIGDAAIASLQSYGIDCSRIIRGGNRLGTYFIELGHSLRPSKVVYDRSHSAISEANCDDFNWPFLLQDCSHLHLSGITPALSKSCIDLTISAAKSAKKLGLTVSFDMNFRRSLWLDSDQASGIFSELLNTADIAFGNAGVMADVFNQSYNTLTPEDAAAQAARDLSDTYGLIAATTCRQSHSANQNTLSGFIADRNNTFRSRSIKVDILDRLGTGDAFASACLDGLIKKKPLQDIIHFANSAFALAHTTYGDSHWSSREDIQKIANGQTGGYIVR